jgi:hypothetical protein
MRALRPPFGGLGRIVYVRGRLGTVRGPPGYRLPRMTDKAAFNAEEWSVVTAAPVVTAMIVIAADRGGTMRETVALSRAYAHARATREEPLIQAILAAPPTAGAAPAEPPAEPPREEGLDLLRRAVGILERLATDGEVVAYKQFVWEVAQAVARAHREGGFLGIGGVEISEKEQVVLDEIESIFDQFQSG